MPANKKTVRKNLVPVARNVANATDYPALLFEVKARIQSSQYAALRAVNKELVGLYWDIGRLIVERQQDARHGSAIAQQLADDLREALPGVSGFSRRNVFYMREFYLLYRDDVKVQPLVAQIAWTHNLIILSRCKDPLEREFYLRMTHKFGWTKNVLAHQIDNQSYEKSLLGQTNFDQTLTPALRAQAKLAVKDEYTFDFLELGAQHGERELERALIARVEEFVGKMQFYLAALDATVRQEDENPSIGIILCKEKKRTVVEYALRDARKPIGVATWEITKTLPEDLQDQLPSPEAIADLLEGI